ncbi:hypothetical protein MA5S0422_0786 [Mycobacteroides abscessus 5S-0422]|uniref:Putative membrane protein n=1 Tax=Mycobacteroides abscessus subsp. bolletii 1513 TaxID=1299321 RepID=X8DNE8_9MYCO|nr:hypothetical protein [Mycobacteroides abscessus]EUA69929.1 putative membrane protein [Mycobacteroides abscessus subsp. bolletii 1513]EIU12037.1 hypothetical protein MA5S0304_5376 [Mycobacteroides abscessus 5S-0304]EIU16743.1 hypothetical protein MA5S0421_0185 [Mycobacteroides abscessus 5S-0421]EIU19130.1 hypothetical protein MA5S0422_0786 [Mycobacteroides abscessus 5S-0422]EIU25202.1 hypothetical protein MA5S0817_4931 [Mycobacteroides abscessus 5S-0817]
MTTLDHVLATPHIPVHPTTPMPFMPEVLFTIFLGIPVVIGVFFAIKHLITGRGPLLAFCLIGGGVACLFEPIVDTLGLCYIREGAVTTTFSSMGRDFPLFINFVYIWYVGGLAYLAYRIYSTGVTRKAVFQLYVIDVFINIWLESPGVLMGAYEYYGPQPLNFWGLPLWWVCVNPVMPMTAGALIYRLSPHLPGWRLAMVIAFIPMADGIANGATAWPVWTALNLNASLLVTHLAWLVTLGLALTSVWILSFVVARADDEVFIKSKVGVLKAAIFGTGAQSAPPAMAGSHS